VAARKHYVERHLGAAALPGLAEELEGEAREWLLQPPMPMRWCSIAPMIEIDELLLRRVMHGDEGRMRAFGAEIAKHDLSTVYRVLMRIGTPEFVLRNVSLVWGTYFRPGNMRAEVVRGRAEVALEGVVVPEYLCRDGATGWMLAALELSGAANPEATHTECAHHGGSCRWRATWG
jgi:hypothetical protein